MTIKKITILTIFGIFLTLTTNSTSAWFSLVSPEAVAQIAEKLPESAQKFGEGIANGVSATGEQVNWVMGGVVASSENIKNGLSALGERTHDSIHCALHGLSALEKKSKQSLQDTVNGLKDVSSSLEKSAHILAHGSHTIAASEDTLKALKNTSDTLLIVSDKLSAMRNISVSVPNSNLKTILIAASGALVCAAGAYLFTQKDHEEDQAQTTENQRKSKKRITLATRATACIAAGLALILFSNKIVDMVG